MARGVNDYFLVEGHRDNFELTARRRQGRPVPAGGLAAPACAGGAERRRARRRRGRRHHRDGYARPLEGSLDVLDMFLNDVEALRAGARRYRSSSPRATCPGAPTTASCASSWRSRAGAPSRRTTPRGSRCTDKLALLRSLFRLGIRSLHLTHQGRNELGDGGDEADGGRLSRFGVAVLGEAHRLGMNVSLAHLTDSNLAHALEVAEQPLTATHDNARAVYAHPRNFTDPQLRAVAAHRRGGGRPLPAHAVQPERLPDDYLDHVDHVARVAGPAHVGIGWLGADAGFREFAGSHGNSFRTAPDGEPLEMREAYETFIERLASRWSDDHLRAFLGGNYLRVLRQVLPETGYTETGVAVAA